MPQPLIDTSLSGLRVARGLKWIIEQRGKPRMTVSDNRSEFSTKAVVQWTEELKVEWPEWREVRHPERSMVDCGLIS